jgi:hypothetical protein
MESPTGEEIYMYVGSPNTMGHGEVFTEPPVYPGPPQDLPPWRPPLSPPTGGVSLLRLRKHGFVAVEGQSRPLLPLVNSTGGWGIYEPLHTQILVTLTVFIQQGFSPGCTF